MKKAIACIVLALLLVMGQPVERAQEWLAAQNAVPVSGRPTAFERELGAQQDENLMDLTLYFRYGTTEMLGAQRMQLDVRGEETIAHSIVSALIAGPDAAHEKLEGLFPQGTQLISVTGDNTTMFVTLSREFLGRPDGAPADWEDIPAWDEEATRRRLLAAQSIVLSLTEDARCQRVQLYIADSDDDVPERIALAWFDLSQVASDAVLTACGRDEGWLLTPERVLRRVLDAWQKRDWEEVYGFLTEEATLPTSAQFAQQMEEAGISLVGYDVTGGSVGLGGESATLVMSARIRSDEGGDALLERESVQLVRREDNWTLPVGALQRLMIRD